MTGQFTKLEMERLNKILSVEINPFLYGDSSTFPLSLGKKTQEWLFETRMNLPKDVKQELHKNGFDDLPEQVRAHILNEILEERKASSAPKWWELNFFEANIWEMWHFFVDQCRANYDDQASRDVFDFYLLRLKELNQAKDVLNLSQYNKDKYSEEEIHAAFKTVDRSYPMDFRDYEEAPQKTRSPVDYISEFIAPELSDLSSIFSKRWFEFKILDELASYISHSYESGRDSELSRQIEKQVRGYRNGQVLALGRMVEHYRWKFSYEEDALRGIQSVRVGQIRGKKGGEASERTKRLNLECLLAELEDLKDLFPRMSEQAIFSQAYANASEKRKMPKSQKTIDDYGTILRSDARYKARYRAIFQKNA